MKHNPEFNSSGDSSSSSEWESVLKSVKEFNAKQVEEAPENAAEHFKNALDIQYDFDRRRQSIESEDGEMSQKEFEKWEDELSDEIGYAERELRKTDHSLETVAKCEKAMIFSTNDKELHKTIEAQAGRFYHERMIALKKAIESSDDKHAQDDLNYAKDFYPVVMSHLDYKYMSRDEVNSIGFDYYENCRTHAHNNAIQHLNGINDLARKYHVRPFTIRNFWPSSIREKKDQTFEVASVMRYDRDLVEEYYAIAFSSDVRKRKAIQERQMRYGIY